MSGFARPSMRPSILEASGFLVMLLGWVLQHSWFWWLVGYLVALTGFIWGTFTSGSRRSGPPSLSEWARGQIGPAGAPEFDILLTDVGRRRRAVCQCLLRLYTFYLNEAVSMARNTPSVVQKGASRAEADFVAARLAECGAKVEIVRMNE